MEGQLRHPSKPLDQEADAHFIDKDNHGPPWKNHRSAPAQRYFIEPHLDYDLFGCHLAIQRSTNDDSCVIYILGSSEKDHFHRCASQALLLARISWITQSGACAHDDPVANPTMALTMAILGKHGEGLSEEDIRSKISPWLTEAEICQVDKFAKQNTGKYSTKNIPEKLSAISALFEARRQEQTLFGRPDMSEKLLVRRDEISKMPNRAPFQAR